MLASTLATLILFPSGGVEGNLVKNPGFEIADSSQKKPADYELTGKAFWRSSGYADEMATSGIALDSYAEGSPVSGAVSQVVPVEPANGKWVTFRFRGKAEDGFAVNGSQLFIQIEFLSAKGTRHQDEVKRLIYREIETDRKDLTANGNFHKEGAAVWRSYELEELLPFAETDAIRVSVGFANGVGKDQRYSTFVVDDFEVVQRAESSTGRKDPALAAQAAPVVNMDHAVLVSLGGKWFYRPAPGENVKVDAKRHLAQKLVVEAANADRLLYDDGRWSNPFRGNMTGWLRKGYLDVSGNLVDKDRVVSNNLVLTFDGSNFMRVRSHNLPNHPTAKFPDTYGTQGYNPGYIQEQDSEYLLPLVPQKNPQAAALRQGSSYSALPMGTVGFAVNGVSFFNPFDADMVDASSIMDRCCGHPNPQENRYHYHKYPICVNTPFVDKGEAHSPIVGFAFDGYPVYGPYEAKGEMAKDSKTHPLDAFNAHEDSVRGWHYHVTPGQFPYIIGGYMGNVPAANFRRPGPRG